MGTARTRWSPGRWAALPIALAPLSAGAQLPPASAESAPVEASASAPAPDLIALSVRGDGLPQAELRDRLQRELGRGVVLDVDLGGRPSSGTLTVTYRPDASELAVTWDSGGRTISRVVEAPAELERVIESSAFLAQNLVLAQTDEIVPAPPSASATASSAGEDAAVPRGPAPAPAAAVVPRRPEARAVTASVFYPLSTHAARPEVTSNLDVNLVYGRVGAIEGGQLGLVNVVTRPSRAWPAEMRGVQLGLFANFVSGDVGGLQLAPLLNVTSGDSTGTQVAGAVNVTSGAVQGIQSALLFNRAGSLAGLQIAALNKAGDVDGVQIGLVNIARNVRGASIGLVNVADDIDGVPLAPVSVTRTGGVHPTAWSGSSGFGNAGVKFATRQTYTLFFASYHRAFDREFVGGGVGLGGRVPLGGPFHADIDAMGTYLAAPDGAIDEATQRSYHEQLVQPRLRLLIGVRAAKHFGVFVGGAAVGQIRAELDWDRVSGAVGPEIVGGVEL